MRKETLYLDLTDHPQIADEVEAVLTHGTNFHGEPYVYARIDAKWRTHPAGLGPIWDALHRETSRNYVDQIDFSDE